VHASLSHTSHPLIEVVFTISRQLVVEILNRLLTVDGEAVIGDEGWLTIDEATYSLIAVT